MGRSPCCSKVGLRRGPWSTKEDTLLNNYIQQHGEGQWRSLPKNAGLLRCGKSCRLRWMNYLRPGIKRGNITEDEEDLIVRLHGLLGNRWSLIAGRLPGRTDNEIKNYWNTHLLKKLKDAGIRPKDNFPKLNKLESKKTNKDKTKKKKKPTADDKIEKEKKQEIYNPPKIKVHLPKPIRVTSAFSRSNSYDSLVSGGSNGEKAAAEMVSYFPVGWPPLFELEDANYKDGEDDDQFVIFPLLNHSDSFSSDVDLLDKVYDEYLQLL